MWKTSRPCSRVGRGLGVVAAGLGELRHGLGDPLGGVGDGEFQPPERGQLVRPSLGLAVGRVDAEDGRHARRLDPDEGRPPPKKTSSDRQRLDPARARRVEDLQRGPGPLARVLDPASQGRMVGDRLGGEEHAEQVLDLTQADPHGERRDGQSPLSGLVEADQVAGRAAEFGGLRSQALDLDAELARGVDVTLAAKSPFQLASMLVDGLATASGLLALSSDLPAPTG